MRSGKLLILFFSVAILFLLIGCVPPAEDGRTARPGQAISKGCYDADNDGYGKSGYPIFLCSGSTRLYDCNDKNVKISPGAPELCSTAWDDDCDGGVNEGCASIEAYFVICSGAGTIRTCSLPNTDNHAARTEEVEFHWAASGAPAGSTVTAKIIYTASGAVFAEEPGLPLVGQTTFYPAPADESVSEAPVYGVFTVLNSAGEELARTRTGDIYVWIAPR